MAINPSNIVVLLKQRFGDEATDHITIQEHELAANLIEIIEKALEAEVEFEDQLIVDDVNYIEGREYDESELLTEDDDEDESDEESSGDTPGKNGLENLLTKY